MNYQGQHQRASTSTFMLELLGGVSHTSVNARYPSSAVLDAFHTERGDVDSHPRQGIHLPFTTFFSALLQSHSLIECLQYREIQDE